MIKYIRDKAHCKYEAYGKENFATIEKEVVTETENHSLGYETVDYPKGFNRENTYVVAHKIITESQTIATYVSEFGSDPIRYTSAITCYLNEDNILLSGRLPLMTVGTNVKVQVLLMKVE